MVVTHEHDDHLGGVARFAKRYAIPVYLTRGTAQWLPLDFPAVLVRFIDSHTPFAVDALSVDPFPVPHDAREPVQFVFSDGDARLGVVTDLGTITQHVVEKLSGCHALVIECNHDLDMLMEGPVSRWASSSACPGASGTSATPTPAASSRPSSARACATSSPRTFRSRTTRPSSRWKRSRRRRGASASGSAWRARPMASPGVTLNH